MSRIWCAFVLLTACTAGRATTTEPSPVPTCPQQFCPACPTSACPQVACPTCLTRPSAPPPAARDWFCTSFKSRKSRKRTIPCWLSRSLCAAKREYVRKGRLGTTTPCVPQRIAFCTEIVDPRDLVRQVLCSSSMSDCEYVRRDVRDQDPGVPLISPCQPMHNTDPYTESKIVPVPPEDRPTPLTGPS